MVIAIVVAACFNAAASGWVLTTTFTNPTPQAGETFGGTVSMINESTLAVANPLAFWAPFQGSRGEVHLYHVDGTHLRTLINTNVAGISQLGRSIAPLDSTRFVAGDGFGHETVLDAGTAFLFSTNGTILTTLTNPAPTLWDYFGLSAVAVGRDKVLVGAYGANTHHVAAGAAYLFDTNGVLLTTYTNPAAGGFSFGFSLAVLNEEMLVVGAPFDEVGSSPVGAVHLVNTNGTIVATCTNPTPEAGDYFGIAVAAAGERAVLIGAASDNTGALEAGAAYLFSTNGTLLTTITNPTPEPEVYFGETVATVGENILLVGATRANGSGIVYVYDSQGNLMTEVPGPSGASLFGGGLAGYKSGKVLIGDPTRPVGGRAYLYSLTGPIMQIRNATSNRVSISWAPELPGFTLQESLSGPSLVGWTNSSSGTNNPATIPIGNESKFFRLTKP